MPQVFRFDDPNEDTRLKQFFSSFGLTESVKKSIEEGKKWGLFYWPTRQDREEMVFEYHKRMNPSTFIVNIKTIYRVFDPRDKKQYLYWYGTKQVRSPPPAETIPGREFPCTNYFDRHVKPVVTFDGTDYYGNPVNVTLTDTEIAYDVDWSIENFNKLVNDPSSKFTNYELVIGKASTAATKGPPDEQYLIRDLNDFLNGDFDELMDFGKNNYDSLDQYRITKKLQAEEKMSWIAGNKVAQERRKIEKSNTA